MVRNIFIALYTFTIAFSLFIGISNAEIAISPAFIDIRLDKGRPAGNFMITNVGDKEERYRIKAIHFTFLKDGGVREIPPDEHSIAQWIKFNPEEFSVPPKTKRTIRFVILPQGNLPSGEYWAAMELESLNTSEARGKDAAGRELKIEVIPTILVPIFGQAGDVIYDGSVKEIIVNQNEKAAGIDATVNNNGDGRILITGEYEITDESDKVVEKGSLGKSYILPGSDRKFSVNREITMPEGNYKINIRFNGPQLKKAISNESRFIWKSSL